MGLYIMAATNDISVHAAVVTVGLDIFFCIRRRTNTGNEGFSLEKKCFRFTPS